MNELENGSFTYALIRSLQGLSEDNCATVERLINSLKKQVPLINSEHKVDIQIPDGKYEPDSKKNLILLPDYIPPSVTDIELLELKAHKAEKLGNFQEAETIWRSLIKSYSTEAIDSLINMHIERYKQQNVSQPANFQNAGNKTPSNKKEQKKPIIEDLGNGVKLEMIHIPAGEFMMGSSDEEIEQLCQLYTESNRAFFKREVPQHQVKLKEFYLGKYPVTQAQYQAVMGENPSSFQGENNPVNKVSWHKAQEFCQKLSDKTGNKYQLPSESQWEYACRAGSKSKWCFGDDESLLKDYAWFADNSGDSIINATEIWQNDLDNYIDIVFNKNKCRTHAVGEKNPNIWGLYDMHGNVWEWCEDDLDNYQNTPKDGKSNSDNFMEYIVLRGASYHAKAYSCRSAYRLKSTRDSNDDFIGFRIMLIVPSAM